MAHRLNISGSVLDQAKVNFKEIYDQAGQKSHEAIAGACLYVACRQIGAPRTFKEICAVCTVSKKEIGRCFKWIIKTLEKTVKTISSEDFMMRFCFSLNLTKQVEAVSTKIAKRSVELDLAEGRSPISLAAAAIYMASQTSKTRKTAKEISDVTGVSEVTIHQMYKEMLPHAEELRPKQ
ncbi:Oidioi.mRNA.OKI2018_I69.chr1.g1232.t1.cds [Oikopleura dioica]|uniref:Transcription initiation factor IIB n=1 Tax=Oikopleura dioica TaxID=34765 RepID=A0ABN7SM99_OIKDI|nr:Oidioi.mRNA.OKI2018_I69.chr1.g1232.t1.cds [Oikopleura dioica]